jgi:hypothetical protein
MVVATLQNIASGAYPFNIFLFLFEFLHVQNVVHLFTRIFHF